MATYGHTFTSGDTVTPTKLNNARTVSDIVNADISATAAIAATKLASDSITNTQIKSDAAIAGTKIAPNFGSQNVVTTGTLSAGATTIAGTSGTAQLQAGTASNGFLQVNAFDNNPVYCVVGGSNATSGVFGTQTNVPTLFFTNNTERMRIAADGSVGIGTSSPSEKLTVSGTADGGQVIAKVQNLSSASGSQARIDMTTGSPNAYGILFLQEAASPYGELSHGSGLTGGMWFTSGTASAPIVFQQSTSERMRISSSGNLLVGTASDLIFSSGSTDGAAVNAANSISVSRDGANCLFLRRRNTDGNVVEFFRSNSIIGSISTTATATAYNTSSDYRLKENATPLAGGLATVSQLNPVEFNWKLDGSLGRGFIAHELQAVVPEAVNGAKDAVDADGNPAYQGVDASKLVPYLVAAVQELSAKVAALEAAQ